MSLICHHSKTLTLFSWTTSIFRMLHPQILLMLCALLGLFLFVYLPGLHDGDSAVWDHVFGQPRGSDDWHEQRSAFIHAQLMLSTATPRLLPVRSPPADHLRTDSYPLISGDTFRSVCHWTFDETGNNNWSATAMQPGQLVFVKTDMLEEFFTSRHSSIRTPYILITHNSDQAAPGQYLSRLNDSILVAWYGQNGDATHPKFHPLPIGFANRQHEHGNMDRLMSHAQGLLAQKARPARLYVNLGTSSNPTRQVFIDALKMWGPNGKVRFASNSDHGEYLSDMMNSKFVLSPPGNGIDCHRTWEALLMGAVPVVLPSHLFGELRQSSPVMTTPDFLRLSVGHLDSWDYGPFDGSGVFANFWFKQFHLASLKARHELSSP